MFIDDSRVVFIGSGVEGKGIYTVRAEGRTQKRLLRTVRKTRPCTQLTIIRCTGHRARRRALKTALASNTCSGTFTRCTGQISMGQRRENSNREAVRLSQTTDSIGTHTVFSPDGKKLAWIPAQTEPDCTFAYVYPELVDTYARRCYIMYIASLSDLDHPVKVVLMPPPVLWRGVGFRQRIHLNVVISRRYHSSLQQR